MDKTFTAKFKDQDGTFTLGDLTAKVREDTEIHINKVHMKALQDGYPLEIELKKIYRDRGIDPDSEAIKALESLQVKLDAAVTKLLSGREGYRKLSKKEGRELALSIRKMRSEINTIQNDRKAYFRNTAEKIADDERLVYWIYATLLDAKTQRPFFRSYEDFKENLGTELVGKATGEFLKDLVEKNIEFEKDLPENKWLIKFKFADEKLRLLNENGEFIDEAGNRVNDKGEPIDADGKVIEQEKTPLEIAADAYTD